MKSRFWNSWAKDEPKVRSSIVVKDRDDNRDNCDELRTKIRHDNYQLKHHFGSNGKLRNNELDNHDDNDHDHDDDDDNDDDDDVEDESNFLCNEKNSEFIWETDKSLLNESRRRKSKNTDTDQHDKCNQVKLTNGKSRTSNGLVKQVKQSDESLRSLERERQGANFQPTYDDKKHYFYNDRKKNGHCEPIKFVRKIEDFNYNKRDNNDLKLLNKKCQKLNRNLSSKDQNGDFIQGRSLSTIKDDPGSKGCKEEFVYVDKRSWRNDNDRLFNRDIELLKEEENGRHNIINGSRRSRSNDYSQKNKICDKVENIEDYNSQMLRYERTREPRKSSDLVKSSRENEHDGGLRRSCSSYRKDKILDDKITSKCRELSCKRESSRDRQIFRKISFKLKSKDPSKKDLKNNNESESIRSKARRDNHRHSRPLSPPTLEDLEVEDVSRHCKVFSSKDYRDECIREEEKSNHNYRDSRDLSWVEKELSWYSSEESPERDNKFSSDNEDSDDVGFSTIERNGTTVIRIHTNSKSPERIKSSERSSREKRYQFRRSRNNISMKYRNRYDEDDAEEDDEDDDEDDDDDNDDDMDEDINFFNQKKRPSDSLSTRNHRDSSVQITDLEDGQPCLQCGETCSGFSPHTWRKNCTSCKCPKEVHDVCHEEWVSVRARLGLKGEDPNNYIGCDPREKGLAWAPPGLPPHKVEEYFSMLPEISVPRLGTPGERHRDRQLATQLPKQDLARAYCRHLDSRHYASADDFMAARNEIALDIGSVQEVLERGHECGVCHESLKYGSLAVMASKLGLLYHPSCFQCTQCRELLVDLAYCVHDDALYCERHYAEKLKPRCAACDELIFSGEYTKAMNKDWHSGHFCCWQCDESLTGQRYVLRDEHPYCIKCYESVFANGCEECSKIIGIDSKDLSYKDKHWHEACFLCNKCRVSLVDKQFGSKADKIYCGNCYDAQFASRCDGCGEIFRAGTKKMEYKTRQWHEKCFCCVVCKNPIGTKSFIPREQEIYCAGCYEDKFATRCIKCNKIITSGGVTYKNDPWHRDCFTCTHCNNSLAGQRFTSRDDKPYCAECFGELFAKRCTSCSKPITGIGGTRFISFEDRHWHNDCFICAGCNTSLVGRGFITDGDDIICPECAKQKLSE